MAQINLRKNTFLRVSSTAVLRAFVFAAFVACVCLITARSYRIQDHHPFEPGNTLSENQWGRRSSDHHKEKDDNICTTKACHDWAKWLKNALAKNHTKTDPCADFATWACGGWKEAHELGSDDSEVSTLSLIQDENDDTLRHVLESPYDDKGYADIGPYKGENATYDRENFEKMKAAYDACMDQDSIKKVGIKPLKDLVSALPGPETYCTKDGLTDTIIWAIENTGVIGLATAYVDTDAKHPEKNEVHLGSGTYMLESHEYYDDKDTVKNYTKAISATFAEILGGHAKDYHDIAGQVIDLEAEIARAEPSPVDTYSVKYTYNVITVAEADELVPNITFSNIIKAFAPEGYVADTVINTTPDYFPQLASVMRNTSAEVIHAYFQWEIIQSWAYRLHDDYHKPLRAFNNWLSGYPENSTDERWRTCLAEVDANLPFIEDAFFIRHRFNDEAKRIGEEMTQELKDVFTSRLDTKYDWMSEEAIENAKKKVTNMIGLIGYPTSDPNTLNPAELNKYYENAVVCNSSYWDNGISFNNYSVAFYWNSLVKPTNRYEWYVGDDSSVKAVTAYYTPWRNSLVVTAGNMQFPYFHADLPDHINYGGQAGSTIGHEMTHGFDSDGREYDWRGAYHNWWDNATRANFDKRTQCIVDQFDKYTVPGMNGEAIHVNGKQTLTENIADTGGLSLGYEAWKNRARTSKANNKLLPGMEEFSPEKLYFLSYAASWCWNVRAEQQVEWARTDVHAPTDLRINGPVANSRAFREAFDCPVKEPTCELW